MSPVIRGLRSLDAATGTSVRALADAATRADGVAPLNERAMLDLDAEGSHLVVGDADVVAYAQVADDGTGQLVVHPEHRRRGLGRTLADRVGADHPRTRLWAFGDQPGAQALARASGRAVVRELLIMERPLSDLPGPDPRPGVHLRSYDPANPADAEAVVAVNAAAFASHPEQGAMDAADLTRRYDEGSTMVLATDAASDEILGFHWTKDHGGGLGEVYVLGVAPRAAGRGIGRTLLWAGLGHLAREGADRVILYVEGDNDPAVRLYETSGFRTVHRDVLYGAPATNEGVGT